MRRIFPLVLVVPLLTVLVGHPAAAGIPPIPLPAVQFRAEMIGEDCYITFIASTTATIGRAVEWRNEETDTHWFQEDSGLWEIQLAGGETFEGVAAAAGIFSQSCDDGPSYSWNVDLKARAHPAAPDFKVTWATPDADASWRYDVEFRVGSRSWRTWFTDSATRTAIFDGVIDRTYRFRSRVVDSDSSAHSGWSPRRTVFT